MTNVQNQPAKVGPHITAQVMKEGPLSIFAALKQSIKELDPDILPELSGKRATDVLEILCERYGLPHYALAFMEIAESAPLLIYVMKEFIEGRPFAMAKPPYPRVLCGHKALPAGLYGARVIVFSENKENSFVRVVEEGHTCRGAYILVNDKSALGDPERKFRRMLDLDD